MIIFKLGCLILSLAVGGMSFQSVVPVVADPKASPIAAVKNSVSSCFLADGAATDGVKIAEMWSGVRTQVGAAMADDHLIYAAFYDQERYVTVASYDALTKQVCYNRLQSQFSGWDSHNALAVAISADGTIHVTGNMHASPLVYARGTALNDISLTSMTGQNEQHVTYPEFFVDGTDALMFKYRDGRSGNGIWRINRWADGRWIALPPLFDNVDDGRPTSAYPTPLVKDRSGRFHVAIIWRRSSDVASNYKVTYASTTDFQSWRVNGKSVEGPLRADDMELVDTPGEGNGLINNAAIHLSPTGKPFILFTKYAPNGMNAIYLADRGRGDWQQRILASSAARVQMTGGGSIPDLPSGIFINDEAGELRVRVSFGQDDQRMIQLDPDTLESIALRPENPIETDRSPPSPTPIVIPKGVAESSRAVVDVRSRGVSGPSFGRLRWFGQKPNRDRPYLCTDTAPLACNPPPSPLMLYLP